MRFGNCSSCNKYKYIKKNGKCPTCLGNKSNSNQLKTRSDISELGGERDILLVGQKDGTLTRVDMGNRIIQSQKSIARSEIIDIYSQKGTSYIISKNGKAISYENGKDKVLWEKSIHNKIQAGMTVSGTGLYNMYQMFNKKKGKNYVQSVIQCYDIHKKTKGQSKRWAQKINTTSKKEFGEDIVSDNKNLYIGTNEGNVLLRHLNNGNSKSSLDLDTTSRVSAMGIDDKNIYCGMESGEILKIEKDSIGDDNIDIEGLVRFTSPVCYLDAKDGQVSAVVNPYCKVSLEINGSSVTLNSRSDDNVTVCTKILNSDPIYGEKPGNIVVR